MCGLWGLWVYVVAGHIDPLVRQQNSQISQIVSRRSGHDRIPQRLKKRIGIEASQVYIRIQSAGPGAFEGTAIHERSCGRAVAVNAVRSRAQHGNGLAGDSRRTGQGKLLVAASGTAIPYFHRDFPAG